MQEDRRLIAINYFLYFLLRLIIQLGNLHILYGTILLIRKKLKSSKLKKRSEFFQNINFPHFTEEKEHWRNSWWFRKFYALYLEYESLLLIINQRFGSRNCNVSNHPLTTLYEKKLPAISLFSWFSRYLQYHCFLCICSTDLKFIIVE